MTSLTAFVLVSALTATAACTAPRTQLSLSAHEGVSTSPFRDGARQSFELVDAGGQKVAEGVFGQDAKTIELPRGNYVFVSYTRSADTLNAVGGDEPLRSTGPLKRMGVSDHPGRIVGRCEAVISLSGDALRVDVDVRRPGCLIDVSPVTSSTPERPR